MGLQWMILTYAVGAEAAIALLLTIPSPTLVKKQIVSLISKLLQPLTGIVPFAAFQLLDIYWKNEHRMLCTSEVCTSEERARFEKAMFKSQRNVILCVSAIMLYWSMYQIVKFYKSIEKLEEEEKLRKEL
ncbi:hypothetical protein ZOSMA_66G00590 [Zostera marina]|uniref:Endoplasmic reticulum transmembrane protein n=1 Tax=Zostera marina TaxID=29655 RepID=A0A0K9NSA4_ZOSMR|nr:hypothetical protein ZOSMA_66G00590 [Zostera marina]